MKRKSNQPDVEILIIRPTVCDSKDVFPHDKVTTDPDTAARLLVLGKAHVASSDQAKKWLEANKPAKAEKADK